MKTKNFILGLLLLTGITWAATSDVERSPTTTTRKNSTGSDFTRKRLNVIEGSNVTVTMSDDSSNNEIDLTITAAAAGGGGASTLAVGTGTTSGYTGVIASSPTAIFLANNGQMSVTLQGDATAFLTLLPSSVTLQGNTLGGDVTGTLAASVVGNDSHDHTGATLSGIDISDDTNLAASQPLVLTGDTLFLSTNVYVSKMGVSWDGGGSALTTGTTYWFPIPSSGTLTGFTLTGLPSGSVTVNVSSSSVFNTGPVSICASACPTLSAATIHRDVTLTGWAKTLAKDGFLYFVITTAATATQANLALEWVKL